VHVNARAVSPSQVNSLQVDAETVIKISDLGISRFSEGNDALMTIGRGTTKWCVRPSSTHKHQPHVSNLADGQCVVLV
jgi:hypothetical protein